MSSHWHRRLGLQFVYSWVGGHFGLYLEVCLEWAVGIGCEPTFMERERVVKSLLTFDILTWAYGIRDRGRLLWCLVVSCFLLITVTLHWQMGDLVIVRSARAKTTMRQIIMRYCIYKLLVVLKNVHFLNYYNAIDLNYVGINDK